MSSHFLLFRGESPKRVTCAMLVAFLMRTPLPRLPQQDIPHCATTRSLTFAFCLSYACRSTFRLHVKDLREGMYNEGQRADVSTREDQQRRTHPLPKGLCCTTNSIDTHQYPKKGCCVLNIWTSYVVVVVELFRDMALCLKTLNLPKRAMRIRTRQSSAL